MNTLEKIDRASNPARLCLHKEGIFYKLYNQHAMLFTQNIKTMKVKVKFVKAVNQEVYSCGFPAAIIEDIKKQCNKLGGEVQESEKLLTVANVSWKNENNYAVWCKQQKSGAEKSAVECGDSPLSLEKEIAAFQVMHKTPMEAMAFIVELQNKIAQRQ